MYTFIMTKVITVIEKESSGNGFFICSEIWDCTFELFKMYSFMGVYLLKKKLMIVIIIGFHSLLFSPQVTG